MSARRTDDDVADFNPEDQLGIEVHHDDLNTSGGGGDDQEAAGDGAAGTPSSGAHSGNPPARGLLPLLTTDGTRTGFFPSTEAAHRITSTIQTCYDRPIQSFSKLNEQERRHWFAEFKSHFTTRPEEDGALYAAFKHRCAKRLQDMYQFIKTGKDREHRWLAPDKLQVLQSIWSTEDFRRKSRQTKSARASQKGGPMHTGGSSTIPNTKRRMEVELKRPPTHSELFFRTHRRKEDDRWVDERSERTYAEYTRRLEEAKAKYDEAVRAGGTPEPVDETAVWFETVGGTYKGRVYGMGVPSPSVASSNAATSTTTSTPASVDSAEVIDLREQVLKLTMELQSQAESSQAEVERQVKRRAEELQARLDKKLKHQVKKHKKEMAYMMTSLEERLLQKMEAIKGPTIREPQQNVNRMSSSSSSSSDDDDYV